MKKLILLVVAVGMIIGGSYLTSIKRAGMDEIVITMCGFNGVIAAFFALAISGGMRLSRVNIILSMVAGFIIGVLLTLWIGGEPI